MAQNHKLPNHFAYGWMSMETREKDVFSFLMYQMSKMPIKEKYSPEEHFFEFDADLMVELSGKEGSGTNYKEAVAELVGKKVKFMDVQSSSVFVSTIVAAAKFKEGTSVVQMEVPQMMLPKLVAGANNYTLIDLEIIMALRKKYAKRLYELLSVFRTTGDAYFEIMDFRGKMGTLDLKTGKPLEHAEMRDFKRWVIDKSIDEINEKYTDFKVGYDFVKRGRKYVGIHFTFDFKAYQTKLPFEKLARENPDSETGVIVKKLNRFGITADWQIDFILKYRRQHLDDIFNEMKEINYEQVMKSPGTCRSLFSYVAKCKNLKQIEEWKFENNVA